MKVLTGVFTYIEMGVRLMQTITIISVPHIILAVLLFLIVVVAGIMIISVLVERKWGYTLEREQELEERIENNRSGNDKEY